MKKYLLFALLTMASLFIFSAMFSKSIKGNGTIIKETRILSNVSKVDVSGAFQVKIIIGEKELLEISADENIMPLITSVNNDDTVKIYPEQKISPSKTVECTLYLKKITSFDGSGSIDLTGEINSEKLDVDLSGSSEVNLSGIVKNLKIDISGSSQINAEKLQAENVSIDASGSSDVTIFATNSLDIDVSGSSKVTYFGNPKTIKQDVSGSVKIKKADK